MPLFLVRWPSLKATLVSAARREDVLDILDEVTNAEGFKITQYKGPLWIDFDIPAKWHIEEKVKGVPLRPDEIVIDDASNLDLTASVPRESGSDTVIEMEEAILKAAFPNIHDVLEREMDCEVYEGAEPPPEGAREQAVARDLLTGAEVEWRRASVRRRTDRAAVLAQMTDSPVELVEDMLRETGELPPKSPKTADVRKLKSRKKAQKPSTP